jgi:ABC-type phosphate transport system permease subunit
MTPYEATIDLLAGVATLVMGWAAIVALVALIDTLSQRTMA